MINVYRVDNDYLNKFDGWNKIFKYFYYQDHMLYSCSEQRQTASKKLVFITSKPN